MMRDVLSPGGTLLGTQALADTPHKQHRAWQYEVPPERHRWGGRGAPQSQRDVLPRRSQKGKTRRKSEEAPRKYFVVRALRVGIGQGGPYSYSYVIFCMGMARQTDNNVGRTQVTQLHFLAQSDVRRKKLFRSKSSKLSSLFRTEML